MSVRAPVMLLVIVAVVLVAIVLGPLALWRVWRRRPARPAPGASGGVAGGEDRQAVLRMLADGKVSADEASALLDALGAPGTPGDRLPLSGGTIASLVAGVMIAAGFVLPWVRVNIAGMRGYQAGHHVGFLGWLILSLGLLPAVLACIPALDRFLRQGMLRLLLACTGLAFAGSLAVRVLAGRSFPHVGLVIVLLGFGVQLLSALMDTGALHRPPGRASD